ncbi:hypothetical protein CCACVL1_29137 [Corchorus capsularis]|uniref:CCHC-type domain-containing protein n=1 Tax=Corchorus capsularis TaxID=210143 RepID=A0A1R3G3I5_COCAP|nr:hypothetical protein CCACVL1_29137 [Corchorus capsularis]
MEEERGTYELEGFEELEIQLMEDNEELEQLEKSTLIGRIISDRLLSKRGVMGVLRTMWIEDVVTEIRDLAMNTFSLRFSSDLAKRRALEDGPWSIMGSCLALKEWRNGIEIYDMDFSEIEVWVQIHKIPLEMMNLENAGVIGKRLGRVVSIEDPKEVKGVGSNFIRIRLGIDICKPLVEGFWIPRREGRKTWAEVKYEKLSDFCYGCGKLGHMVKNCHLEVQRSVVDPSKPHYGPHMRAAPVRRFEGVSAGKGKQSINEESGVAAEHRKILQEVQLNRDRKEIGFEGRMDKGKRKKENGDPKSNKKELIEKGREALRFQVQNSAKRGPGGGMKIEKFLGGGRIRGEKLYEIRMVKLSEEFRGMRLKREGSKFLKTEEEYRSAKRNRLEWYDMTEENKKWGKSDNAEEEVVPKSYELRKNSGRNKEKGSF